MGLFSTTMCISRHQKGRNLLAFNEAVASAGPLGLYKSLAFHFISFHYASM